VGESLDLDEGGSEGFDEGGFGFLDQEIVLEGAQGDRAIDLSEVIEQLLERILKKLKVTRNGLVVR
jgi:hypothetical protein